MTFKSLDQLPKEHGCRLCGNTKPLAEMIVIFLRKEKVYYLRPRCKACHNARERGHRREYKRKHLQRWRRRNAALNKSYWKGNERVKEQARMNAARRFKEHHDAFLIQGRLRRRGVKVSLKSAKELLEQFGPCYPTRYGLTPVGLRECERIRSTMRRRGSQVLSPLDIRMMVYEDGLYISPDRQQRPYQTSAEHLRKWQQGRRSAAARKAA